MTGLTPSQTVGPFFELVLPWPRGRYVVPQGTPGAVWLRGRVLDGEGAPVVDALVETWQASAAGRYDEEDFRGFGRCPTDAEGQYEILTVKPGAAAGAPHLAVAVFARGMLDRVVTRVYFPDEEAANAADPVLGLVPEHARPTLIARPDAGGYLFDIRLQGDDETIFFSI